MDITRILSFRIIIEMINTKAYRRIGPRIINTEEFSWTRVVKSLQYRERGYFSTISKPRIIRSIVRAIQKISFVSCVKGSAILVLVGRLATNTGLVWRVEGVVSCFPLLFYSTASSLAKGRKKPPLPRRQKRT